MPVKRDPASKVKPHNPAVDQAMQEMFERNGVGPKEEAAARARTVELIQLGRKLSGDERRELDKLIKRWNRERDDHRRNAERSARARQRWAERAGTPWAAKWEARAVAAAGRLNGEEFYWLWVLTDGKTRARKEAKRDAREAATEAAEHAAEEAAEDAAMSERMAPKNPVEPAPTTYRAPALLDLDELPGPAPRRSRRKEVGVVAVYDQDGNRVA